MPLAAAFLGDKFILKTNYKDDEKKHRDDHGVDRQAGWTRRTNSVGIHGRHLDEGSRIHYISIDEKRQ